MCPCVPPLPQAFLLFDVTKRSTFEALDGWLEEAVKFGLEPTGARVMVVAHKVDLPKRAVTTAEGVAWADQRGFQYTEASASSGVGVEEVFDSLLRRVDLTVANP